MSQNLSSGRVTADVSGYVSTKDYEAEDMQYIMIENLGTDELTLGIVPTGKKWLVKQAILSRYGTAPTAVTMGYSGAETPNYGRIWLTVANCTPTQRPLDVWLTAGEKIGWTGTDPDGVYGWISYLEFDA